MTVVTVGIITNVLVLRLMPYMMCMCVRSALYQSKVDHFVQRAFFTHVFPDCYCPKLINIFSLSTSDL